MEELFVQIVSFKVTVGQVLVFAVVGFMLYMAVFDKRG